MKQFLWGILWLTSCLGYSQTNEGVHFWFGFMEHIDERSNTKVAMITSKMNTTGTIRMPRQSWSHNFGVAANEVTIVQLPINAETFGSESKTNTGIEVVTSNPVSVYIHQYSGARSEAAAVLPMGAIGREYYVMSYPGVNRMGTVYPSEMLIVCGADDTNLEIEVNTNTMRGKKKGDRIKIQLNAGETYQVQAQAGNDDLSGTYVSGDKDFAIFAGAKWTEVPTGCNFRDNLLEQMYPIATWGKQYVTVPNHGASYDVFRVMAANDNTRVEISNGDTYQLGAGEFKEYRIRGIPTFISANQPIIVAQYNIGQDCNGYGIGDPSMVLLNSIEQTRDTVTLFNSSFQDITENFINIITRTTDTALVKLDGQKISAGYTYKSVHQNYSYVTARVNSGSHTITSEGCGIIATAYGYGNVESYAYGGGASFTKINANPIPVGGCLSDTIFFDSGLSPNRFTFYWDLGDGNFSTQARFMHQYEALGTYQLKLFLHNQCLDTYDTLSQDLLITLRESVDAFPGVSLCEADTLRLGATDVAEATYVWKGPAQYYSTDQFPVISHALPEMSGTYEVIGIVSGCATYPKFLDVDVVPLPKPDLGKDTIICDLVGGIDLNPGTFNTYSWQDGSSFPTLTTSEEGIYTVAVSNDFGCINTDDIILTKRCPTRIFAPNAFTPNGDQINDTFQLFGQDIISGVVRIFDRWGNLLFETSDYSQSWDGSVDGKSMPAGVYPWIMQFQGYNDKGEITSDLISGTVTLVR